MEGNESIGLKNPEVQRPPLPAGRWVGQLSMESFIGRMDDQLP